MSRLVSAEHAAVAAQLAANPADRGAMIPLLAALADAGGLSREVALDHLAEYRAGVPDRATLARIARCWAPPPVALLGRALDALRAAGIDVDERRARHYLASNASSVADAAICSCLESSREAAQVALGAPADFAPIGGAS